MKSRIVIWITLLLTVSLSAYAVNPRDMKFPDLKFNPPEPMRFVTDNGTVVFFLEDHQLPVMSVSIMFHGGSAYDPADKIGLSDITATLLRTGGAGQRTSDQVDEDLDFVGASIVSQASSDYLAMVLKCLKKDLDLGLGIFADMLQHPLFDTAKISLELSNRKDAIRRQNDDPGMLTRRIFYETIYAGHPYGYFPTLASTDNISRDGLLTCYNEYYNPDNAVMSITGDITLDELKGLLNKYFGKWAKGNKTITPPPIATMQYKPGVYYVRKDINQANIRMGELIMTDKNPDRHAMDVLNFALGGGGFTSRLTGQIRTTAGLAYSVGSYTYYRPEMGSFFAICQTKAETMGEATRMMLDIINQVKDSGITQQEMDMAKESLINSFVFNYATPDQIVDASAIMEIGGFPPDQMKRDLEAFKAVTLADCNRVAAKYLDPKNMAIIITGAKENFDKPLDTFGPVTDVPLEIK
ncbi:putative Peptidase M16 domain protein [Candidatus Zixiibacteriota bacterium]|nr:putative Peptidase M16 domain protein [candidate division Zixibacteria bacterium]